VKRPNLIVRTRKGYWSASPDDVLRAQLVANVTAPKPPPAPLSHASPLIRPWFGVARASSGNMRVSFVWEPVPPVPGDRQRVERPSLVVFKVSKVDGTKVFEGDVRPSNAIEEILDAEPAEAVFESAPGRLRVQIAIEGADSKLLDTDVRDLIVGGLAGPVEVGTAEVWRTRNAREWREVDADRDAAPVAAREFSRAEQLIIRIPAYGAGDGFSVTATLQNRLGKAIRELSVVAVPGADIYQVDLPLASFAVGDYAVAIAAKSTAGEAKDVVSFRVTN
jgi:hypothetical protein